MHKEGVTKGLYKGVTVTLIKAPIAKGLTLALNDIIKKSIKARRMMEDPIPITDIHPPLHNTVTRTLKEK